MNGSGHDRLEAMNLMLHLSPEIEAKLLARACATGKDIESLALEALHDKLAVEEAGPALSRDAWKLQFREFLATSFDGDPAADLSRSANYDDRGG